MHDLQRVLQSQKTQRMETKPKNSKNLSQRLKRNVKEQFEIFYEVYNGVGGNEAFIQWAAKEENRKDFYKMFSKQLPTEVLVSGSEDNTTPINIIVPAAVLDV